MPRLQPPRSSGMYSGCSGRIRGLWSGKSQESESESTSEARLVVLALPLGVGALEVFDAVLVEVPEARGYFVDQVMVVSY